MDSKTSGLAKVKVTASLDAELVKSIDKYLNKVQMGSRSKLIEDALRKWHHDQKRREIEIEIEEYYLSLSDEEREEDQDWSRVAAQSANNLWEE